MANPSNVTYTDLVTGRTCSKRKRPLNKRELAAHAARREAHEKVLATARKFFPRGSTVYTILRNVSRSGMVRHISVVALFANADEPGEIIDYRPNHAVAEVTGNAIKRDAIVVHGAGMDMGFDLTYSLAYALYGDGYALKHRWL